MGETTTHEVHKLYFSVRDDRYEEVCGPTATHSDEEIEDFCDKILQTIQKTPKKDILVVQVDWIAKIGEDAQPDLKGTCGPYCNSETNDRGFRLLEFAKLNNLKVTNTIHPHKASRRWTWHKAIGSDHQIDYILMKKRFHISVKIARTRSFPGADINSDHELFMISFHLNPKKAKELKAPTRIKFDLEKLKDPEVATIGGKFAPLLLLDADDIDADTFIGMFNNAVTETTNEVLGKQQIIKKPWVTPDILKLCDQRRDLKQSKYGSSEGANKYRQADKLVKMSMLKAKEDWVAEQCSDIESSLKANYTKNAYKVVKDLTSGKQNRPSTILNKNGKCLNETKDTLNRRTEYTSELYSNCTTGDSEKLNTTLSSDTDNFPILRAEVEEAVKALYKGKPAGNDNIPRELVQACGNAIINALGRSVKQENVLHNGPSP